MSRRIFTLLLMFLCYELAADNSGAFGPGNAYWLWTDSFSDHRSTYPVDMTSFKVTPSTAGDGIEFEIGFASLTQLNSRIVPVIQIGVSYTDASGLEAM